jgi:hypothetical protein
MQIENDYDKDVYNGDIGMIEDVDLDEGEFAMNFDGRTVTFVFGELDTLCPSLCRHDPQEPGVRIPCRGHSHDDPALRDTPAEPDLHQGDPWEEVGGSGWPDAGRSDRGQECFRAQALVEAG